MKMWFLGVGSRQKKGANWGGIPCAKKAERKGLKKMRGVSRAKAPKKQYGIQEGET